MLSDLFEREAELGRIDALLARARAGNGGVLVVTGPAGIGKSSLLGEARERARLAGMRVLSGRGGELEGDFSFGVARQLFERLLAAIAGAEREALLAGAARRALTAMEDAAGPPTPTATTGDPPFAVVHGLYWLAVNASAAGPVLVAIDDLHWADQASLRFVLYLADRLAGLPVALALTWRTGEIAATGAADCLARTATGAMLQEVRGRLALASGDYPAARGELQAAAETYTALHQLSPGTCWRSALALALAGQDSGKALRLADSELEAARRTGSPRSAGIALRTRGMLQGGQRGLADLREAADVLRESDARLEHARALVEFGAALRRANQRAAAREPLRAGLDLAYRCGAGRLAHRAATELRATGARPRRAVLTGLEALTPSERRVAELAAGGMTNPEIAQALFVTLNTVEGHLRHVYQKLAISSRGQLPAALRSAAPPLSTRPDEQRAAVAR